MQFEITSAYIEELIDNIDSKNNQKIKELIVPLHTADVADVFDELDLDQAMYMLELVDDEYIPEIIVELEEDVRERILNRLPSKRIASEVISDLETDDAADIIGELSDAKRQEVISEIEDIDHARDIVELLRYDEDTAGGLMAKELIKVYDHWTVRTCVREMRLQAENVDEVHSVYVVDDVDTLLGVLSLKSLLTTSTGTPIKELYESNIFSVNVNESDEDVALIMQKYDLVVIPVVDELNKLVGRITIDDIVDVIVEEAEKDYQMASGISQDVESGDTIFQLFKARFPWLLIGLFGGLTSGNIIGQFSSTVQDHVVLAMFIPLIAAMGGNIGVQSSAIVVQGLANNTIRAGELGKRIIKEVGLSLSTGIVLSLIIFAFIEFKAESLGLIGNEAVLFGTIIVLSLTAVVVMAAVTGTVVPMVLNKYKIDPAIATGPFITTTNDILGVFIYFSIARAILY
ncbi:MAG: magnesium transporter [Ichthyobacteriaceae bacterium]|nr:magnesium transporter [Ichthyobacteriaceae bacterium]